VGIVPSSKKGKGMLQVTSLPVINTPSKITSPMKNKKITGEEPLSP
jgi:hypothetical protein